MNKWITLSILSLSIAAFSSTLAARQPKPVNLHADLGGAEQVVDTQVGEATLPVIGLVTGAHGEAHFRLMPDRSALHYTLKVTGTATPIFMAHIHLGPKGRNGPVMLWLFGHQGDNPLGFTVPRDDGPFMGEISGTLTPGMLASLPLLDPEPMKAWEQAIANILNGNAYVNVHTVANPPGEVRGQIDIHRHSIFDRFR